MAPGVLSDEQNLEKQLAKKAGCMAGFLHIFDRHQLISGKRIYGPKRIPALSATGSTSPSDRSDLTVKEASEMFASSPNPKELPAAKGTVPLPVQDIRDGMKNSWKLREGPRLSLDSRLRHREVRTAPPNQSDAESDQNRRSPSVIARLMGLDALPDSAVASNGKESLDRSELRRSASESRVSREPHRLADGCSSQNPPPPAPLDVGLVEIYRGRPSEPKPATATTKAKQTASVASIQPKSYFDAQDFFPEPDQVGSRSLYGEIEKRLRLRGIDDPAKDLETLKQVFEALKLKGLLHSPKNPSNRQINHRRNLIFDDPIVIMKPGPKLVRRSESDPTRLESAKPALVQERRVRCRSSRRSPDPSSRRPVHNVEPARRISYVHSSPKSNPRRLSPDTGTARSPRNQRPARESECLPADDDTATSISESTPQFDFERSRVEYGAGRSLLERCDKLLHSIAAFTSAEQPSPVSVLESSYLTEESSPSPVMNRSIDFKGPLAEWGDDVWVPLSPKIGSRPGYVAESEYPEFAYVSDVVLAAERHRDPLSSDVYLFLEKRHARENLRQSALGRRLVFDAVVEILERKRHVSLARRSAMCEGPQLIREVWAEVRQVREEVAAEDVNAVTCGAIRKDIASGGHRWGDTSDAVLGIERLVFKDLVGEVIRDLSDLVGVETRKPLPRRKLLF